MVKFRASISDELRQLLVFMQYCREDRGHLTPHELLAVRLEANVLATAMDEEITKRQAFPSS